MIRSQKICGNLEGEPVWYLIKEEMLNDSVQRSGNTLLPELFRSTFIFYARIN